MAAQATALGAVWRWPAPAARCPALSLTAVRLRTGLAALLVLTACAGESRSVAVRRLDTAPEGTDGQAGQSGPIDWEGCGQQLQCGTLTVPLDYDDPTGTTIGIYMERRLADDSPIGSLLVNPGGPGVPGSVLAADAEFYFSESLLERFDIVAFDPRGTGRSAPVD